MISIGTVPGLVTFIALLVMGFIARKRGWQKEAFMPFLLWFGFETLWFIVAISVGDSLNMSRRQAMNLIESVEQISSILRIAGFIALLLMLFIPKPSTWK